MCSYPGVCLLQMSRHRHRSCCMMSLQCTAAITLVQTALLRLLAPPSHAVDCPAAPINTSVRILMIRSQRLDSVVAALRDVIWGRCRIVPALTEAVVT